MIRLGIVGINYGRTVQLPAFRADPRCQVIALAGRDAARTAESARAAGIAKGYGGWRALVEDPDVQAVAIATLPSLQAQVAIRALELGKPVFIEKPMANNLAAAQAMLRQAKQRGLPTMIDFNFTQIMAWLRAKTMLDAGAVGALRHVTVHWHVESRACNCACAIGKPWAMTAAACWAISSVIVSTISNGSADRLPDLSARIGGLPGESNLETTVAMALRFQAGPLCSLSMSCASYLGIGHRLEFFGEDGTLVLHNPGADYMRGFELFHAKRPAAPLERITVVDPDDAPYPDGRIAPVSRLAKKFFDAIENGGTPAPDFAEGYRVQRQMDAARRSHTQGVWIDFAKEDAQESAP